jgi:hypothetical protein
VKDHFVSVSSVGFWEYGFVFALSVLFVGDNGHFIVFLVWFLILCPCFHE